MITEAGWIIIVTLITGCITASVGLIVNRNVTGLTPKVKSVEEQLIEANKFIVQQGHMLTELRDTVAMRKPTMTEKRFDADFQASPPYRKGKNPTE